MRFGSRLHDYQLPQWQDHYIQYNHLKRLLKTASDADGDARDRQIEAVCSIFERDLDRVEEFQRGLIAAVRSRTSKLSHDFRPSEDGPGTGQSLQESLPERAGLLESIVELFHQVQDLQWFSRVNTEAVTKIVHRLKVLGPAAVTKPCAIVRAPCSEEVLALNALLAQFDDRKPASVMTAARKPVQSSYVSDSSIKGSSHEPRSVNEVRRKLEHEADAGADSRKRLLDTLLIGAIQNSCFESIELLVEAGADVNLRSAADGATPLYVAARAGRHECLAALAAAGTVDVNLAERTRGWTPLMIACRKGDLRSAEILLQASANAGLRDDLGWTAKEHAAYRGHLIIAELLATYECEALATVQPPVSRTSGEAHARPSHGSCFPSLASGSRILVTLGTAAGAKIQPLDMLTSVHGHPYSKDATLGHSLQIDAIGATGPSRGFDLPILHDLINEPLIFESEDPSQVQLLFKLRRIVSNSDAIDPIIGTGVAVLKTLGSFTSKSHESLVREHTIPILSHEDLKLIGTVTFNLVVVRPHHHRSPIPSAMHGFWHRSKTTDLVGHRGAGANSVARNLQIGENTVQSFLSAIDLGASCIEFDVQLTKDLVPVIFHDFLVMETGLNVPVHDLTQQQFVQLGDGQLSKGALSTMAELRHLDKDSDPGTKCRRPRSLSLDVYENSLATGLLQRMKQTQEGLQNPIKGNLRGVAIQERFASFRELLLQLPERVDFDIEMKYPMLWEAQDRDMELSATELNIFVDTVLDAVYELGGSRNISFSSFSPEMCIHLASKQQDFPILLISKAGQVPAGDVRASSLQQAVRFAKRWKLAGIVTLCNPIVLCPALIQVVKRAGLVCASYGNWNDESANARMQQKFGLDAIIVNRVRLISQAIHGHASR